MRNEFYINNLSKLTKVKIKKSYLDVVGSMQTITCENFLKVIRNTRIIKFPSALVLKSLKQYF